MLQSGGTACQMSSACQLAAELQLLETPLDRVCQVVIIKFPRENALMIAQIYFKPPPFTVFQVLLHHLEKSAFTWTRGFVWLLLTNRARHQRGLFASAASDIGQSAAFHSRRFPKPELARLMGSAKPEWLPSVFSLGNFARVLGTCQIRSCLLSLLDWLCQKRK